jgi:hypothetical protein
VADIRNLALLRHRPQNQLAIVIHADYPAHVCLDQLEEHHVGAATPAAPVGFPRRYCFSNHCSPPFLLFTTRNFAGTLRNPEICYVQATS